MRRPGRTAAALTRQLLAFSRREIIEPIVVDLNTVINGMDKMMHRLLGDNIRVETRLAGDLDNIKADRGQLEQVLLNLAGERARRHADRRPHPDRDAERRLCRRA